ncbi:MAG: DUF2752 domain-containing protein [Bacilli bacterium]|nr:DUF2752 domain-containing protein [Bacilli bacterium]
MRNNTFKIILYVIIFLVGSYTYYFLYENFSFSIDCLFHKITGYYCPGCGITRMIFSIIKLEFYQAFRYNPLVFIMLIFFVFCQVINIILKRNYKKITFKKEYALLLLVVVILFGIMRNIPLFDYLKPTILK